LRSPSLSRERQDNRRRHVGSAIGGISTDDATSAIDTAERFVDTIAQILPT
jgi:hypothetical protein